MKEKAIALYEYVTTGTTQIISFTLDGQLQEPLPVTFADKQYHQALKYASAYLTEVYGIPKRNVWAVRLTDKKSAAEFAVFDMSKVPFESRGYVTTDLLPYPHIKAVEIEIDSENKIGADSSAGNVVH